MKWIVVKLSGDAARPAYETSDDTITIRDRVRVPAVANLHQGRRDWNGHRAGQARTRGLQARCRANLSR